MTSVPSVFGLILLLIVTYGCLYKLYTLYSSLPGMLGICFKGVLPAFTLVLLLAVIYTLMTEVEA